MRMAQGRVPRPGESGPANDPREREQWFARLDPDARDVVRAGWVTEQVEREQVARNLQLERRRAVLQGAGVFVAADLALSAVGGLHAMALVCALAVGALVGLAWWRADAGILLSQAIAAPAYFGLQLVLWPTGAVHVVELLVGPVLVALWGAYLGLHRSWVS